MLSKKIGFGCKRDFFIGNALVWGYLYKSSVKDIYSCLVKTSETPKCITNGAKSLPLKLILTQRKTRCNFFLGAQGVSRSCYLLILATPTRHSKGSLLCRYTGVARKVPFKLRPKGREKVSVGY